MSAFYQEGAYQCEVVEYGFTEAQTGNTQFVMRFKVLATEDGEPAERQYTRTFYRTLTEKSMQYFAEDIRNLNWTDITKPLMQLDPNEPQFVDYRGATILMYVKEEPDQKGDTREKWGVARQGGQQQPLEIKKLDGAKKRSLDNLFAAELRNLGSAKPAAPKVTAAKAPAQSQPPRRNYQQASEPPPFSKEITDDDVPF